MKMTRACEYALQGVLYLAMQAPGKVILLSEIAETRAIPQSFLGKIFRHLVKAGIVESIRGIHGGFRLAKNAAHISMRDVVDAVEGNISFSNCSGSTTDCDRIDFCAMAHSWQEAQQRALEVLDRVTFGELAQKEVELSKV